MLLRRYKRFLADIETTDGQVLTIHCPNTGSMKNCLAPNTPVWYSSSDNPKRKYRHTWEIATTPAGHLAGINTGRANTLVREAIEAGYIAGVAGCDALQAEVVYGSERSRIDFVAKCGDEQTFIEVKSVTLCEQQNQGFFPDSVSVRGAKHLRELGRIARSGKRALLVYCVQHSGIESVAPARHIDALYAQAYDEAVLAGVEVIALGATLSEDHITLDRVLPIHSTGDS